MNRLMQMLALVVPLVILLLVVFVIVAKLYKRASKEIAFVRTGAGGPKADRAHTTLQPGHLHRAV